MASKIPLKTTSWRISPDAYRQLLHDADAQLASVREAYREKELVSYQQRVRDTEPNGTGREWAERALLDAEERVAGTLEPRWYLVTKRHRTDTPSGSIDEIVPTIEVPSRYIYASAILRGGEHSIDVTLSSAGPSITLTGTDNIWLQQSERWALEALRKHRPKWWWLATVRGGIVAALVAAGVYFALAGLLPLAGIPQAAATLVGLAADWGILLTVMILIGRFRAPITEPGGVRIRSFVTQAGLLVAGGVLGVIITRIADALFPA